MKSFNVQALSIALSFLLIFSNCNKSKESQTSMPRIASDADLKLLPKDLGGVHTPVYLTNNLVYGYYIYTPSGYADNQVHYPALIFLHGSGEVGNSMVKQSDLQKILAYGPPSMINKKNWAPRYPMIVISPQCGFKFKPDSLNNFIKYIVSQYRIDIHRIYLTGLSTGGSDTYNYLSKFSSNGYIAASVPMSAGFDKQPDVSNLINLPIWNFCGESDDTKIQQDINIVSDINQNSPSLKAKITTFPGVGHNCWDITYTGSGMGKENKSHDAFNMSIYDWMFQYIK